MPESSAFADLQSEEHMWRRLLAAATARALALQDAGHDALLALWALRLRDARLALPFSSSGSSTSGSHSGSHSSSHSSSHGFSVVALLEQFRRGPEDQSEWALALWRVTFPLLTLVLLTLGAVAGKFGLAAYSLLVCPVWFLCNFALVVYPFDVIFRFPDLSARRQRALWRGLALASVIIAALELYATAPRARAAWILGNTLFGLVALAAIPLFFTAQSRVPRELSSALPVALSPVGIRQRPPADFAETVSSSSAELHLRSSPRVAHEPDAVSTGDAPKMMLQSGGAAHSRQFAHATLNRPPPANAKSQLITISAVCVFAIWLAMFASYSTSRSAEQAGAAGRYWFLTYLLSPVLCVVLFCTRQQNTNFSIDHVVGYGVLVVHIPIFLGHFCIRLFAMAEDSGDSDGDSTLHSSGTSWIKLAISVLYLLVMQGYFFVITHVVNAMAEPFAHPSLLYIGQLYYYMFWYILVGSDAPIDALYWGMLLLNNVHIALLNTGIYTDFKRSSPGCAPLALSMHLSSSVAVCFRASTSAGRSRSDTEGEAAALSSGASGNHSSSLVFTQTDDDEQLDASESDGFLSDQESGGGAVKSRRSKQSPTVNSGSGNATSSSKKREKSSRSSSSIVNCPTAIASLRDKRAHDDRDVKRTNSGRKKRAATLSLSAQRASADHLKPLYFLMKLAEQDNMADTTALILVPSLLTLMAVFEKPTEGLAILYDQMNMWVRCICMFAGRLAGSYLAREIFAYKLKNRLRTAGVSSIGTIEGMSTRLWIQRLMLQDFHQQFWYLTVVTIVVTFACFDRSDLPLRFALLT